MPCAAARESRARSAHLRKSVPTRAAVRVKLLRDAVRSQHLARTNRQSLTAQMPRGSSEKHRCGFQTEHLYFAGSAITHTLKSQGCFSFNRLKTTVTIKKKRFRSICLKRFPVKRLRFNFLPSEIQAHAAPPHRPLPAPHPGARGASTARGFPSAPARSRFTCGRRRDGTAGPGSGAPLAARPDFSRENGEATAAFLRSPFAFRGAERGERKIKRSKHFKK